ncbi:sensor histidine kinase MtrB [Mycobacteroides abscessus subsp. abscessus]|nr:sensor histidine kinase MtrB [Mycobacteroides abscessus subsp. abscessus]
MPLVRGHKVTTSPLPLNPTSRPSSAVRRATSRGAHPGEQETTPMRASGAKVERPRESAGGRAGDAS